MYIFGLSIALRQIAPFLPRSWGRQACSSWSVACRPPPPRPRESHGAPPLKTPNVYIANELGARYTRCHRTYYNLISPDQKVQKYWSSFETVTIFFHVFSQRLISNHSTLHRCPLMVPQCVLRKQKSTVFSVQKTVILINHVSPPRSPNHKRTWCSRLPNSKR